MRLINSLLIAFSTYSRIPVPQAAWNDENRRYSMCFFPLIGAVIGLLIALWLWLCGLMGLNGFLRGAIAAMIPLFVTGGIHMDGFMDTSDALASWQPKEKRLEILKDSHTGAFAVMRCSMYLLVQAALFSEATLENAASIGVCFMISRALSAWCMTVFKSARPGGMLDGFAKAAEIKKVTLSGGIYALICLIEWIAGGHWLLVLCPAAAAVCVLVYRKMAYKQFGGVTGDLAGWFLQITELALLAVVILGGKVL